MGKTNRKAYILYIKEKEVAVASSKWVLFDLETNKITKITDEILNLYNPENDSVFKEDEIPKLREPSNQEYKMDYEVMRADIDVNNHMHNLNYLKLAYEILPEEIYEQKDLKNIRIMYKHQIKLKEKVKCYYLKENEKNLISIKSYDDRTLHAVVELE